MKSVLRNNFAIIFFAICWILLSIQMVAFFRIADITGFSLPATILFGCCDALLILSPYFIVPAKWRWSIILPMLIVPIFLYANILYLRWFPDLMSFTILFKGADNATGTVLDGALSCIKPVDLWIGLPFIVFIGSYIPCVRKISKQKFPTLFKYWWIIGICMIFLCEQLSLISTYKSNFGSKLKSGNHNIQYRNFYQYLLTGTRRQQLNYFGIIPYFTLQTYEVLKPKYIRLSDKETKDIADFISKSRSLPLLADSIPDNRDKNLIMIVVESLNSDALNKTANSRPIMPFLASFLENEKNVIILDSVLSQVGVGRSSDGRFIYQTGLLPTTDNPVALNYLDYPYPSLSSALNRDGVEFDCGDPIQWNKIELSKKYGFTKLYSRDEMIRNMKKSGGKDPALFNNALPLISDLKQPFYTALNTMDMHDPYNEFRWKRSDVWQDSTLSDTEKIYIEKCRQFDAGLSQFIAGLKRKGLYDNSVIVITGDHNARPSCLGANKLTNTQIPIIILNSGIDLRSHATIGQSDLYPTILDIMGADDAIWRGVGISVLRNPKVMENGKSNLENPDKPETSTDPLNYPSTEAWRVSDLIIRSAHQRDLINNQ